jgi:hypothetical protein
LAENELNKVKNFTKKGNVIFALYIKISVIWCLKQVGLEVDKNNQIFQKMTG